MQWSNLTFRPIDHVQFYVLGKNLGVRESQNSNTWSHKTEILNDNVPFTLHSLVVLLHNSTTSKKLTIWPIHCLKKRALKLVLWLPEVEDFLFLPTIYIYIYISIYLVFRIWLILEYSDFFLVIKYNGPIVDCIWKINQLSIFLLFHFFKHIMHVDWSEVITLLIKVFFVISCLNINLKIW